MKNFYKQHKCLCWVMGIVLLLTAWIMYGFHRAKEEADIEQLEYHFNNPVSVIFPIPYEVVRDSIEFWERNWKHFSFKSCSVTKFNESDNSFQLRRINTGSYIYRYRPSKANSGQEVIQLYDYEVQIYPVDTDSTIVTVYLVNNEIVSGVDIWLNPWFTHYAWATTPVSSSSIEECELLRYIAKKLGFLHLVPPVQYPKQLTREQILKTFGNDNPFTLNEMFGEDPISKRNNISP